MFNDFEDRIAQPSENNKLIIYSDGNNDYTTVLKEYFYENSINYGQKIKSISGKKIFPAIKKAVIGDPDINDIETNTVESINSVLRAKISRLVRKTKSISKKKNSLNNAINLFKFFWNFIHKRHKKLLTPAIEEGITNKIWTWGNFLHAKLSYTG